MKNFDWSKSMFIELEGIDGSGKTTVKQLIFHFLKENCQQEPLCALPQCWLNPDFTYVIVNAKYHWEIIEQERITTSYVQDKELLCQEIIKPNLNYRSVICDRYFISDMVYHNLLFNVPISKTWEAYYQSKILKPDLYIYIDTNPEIAYQRIISRNLDAVNPWETKEKLKKLHEFYRIANEMVDIPVTILKNDVSSIDELENIVKAKIYPILQVK